MLRMDMRTREQYLKALLGRYLRARKRGKTAILDEYCGNTGMARKSALRKVAGLVKGGSLLRKKRRPVYGRQIRVALEMLREIFDRPCGQQKNFTHVRRPLGYLRYDTPAELELINDLYRNELLLYKNFFQPVIRLVRKDRVDGRIERRYAKPQTPYRILRESGQLLPEQIKVLDELYHSLNPADLKRRIDQKLKKLYALYERKKKSSVRVDPYKKLDPTSVTFYVMQ